MDVPPLNDLELDDSEDEDIKNLIKENKRAKKKIYRHNQKKFGIEPKEGKGLDIRTKKESFTLGEYCSSGDEADEEHDHDQMMDFGKRPLSDSIIISQNSKIRIWWSLIEIWAQLTSSYFYAYLAAFPGAEQGPLITVNLVYEIIFAISIMLKFLYEYKIEDAEQPPVRDLQKIGMRYLKD